MPPESFALLPLGFVLGLVHALDADHVAAVSTLAVREPNSRGSWKISLHWSLGHSAILLLAAGISLQLGLKIPEAISHHAETLVGITMVLLASFLFAQLWRERRAESGREFESHSPSLHSSDSSVSSHRSVGRTRRSAPAVIGGLHGLAGSASFLALLPAMSQDRLATALGYVGLFGLGVTVAMVSFGGLLGFGFRRLVERDSARSVTALRTGAAVLCCAVGIGLISRGI